MELKVDHLVEPQKGHVAITHPSRRKQLGINQGKQLLMMTQHKAMLVLHPEQLAMKYMTKLSEDEQNGPGKQFKQQLNSAQAAVTNLPKKEVLPQRSLEDSPKESNLQPMLHLH
jgi:hypothetical protein